MRSGSSRQTSRSGLLPFVSRLGREARIFHRHPDREVIQALERVIAHAEQIVHAVVEEAADACRAPAGGFGLEIQHLTSDARLPEEMTIERWAALGEARVEVGEHSE